MDHLDTIIFKELLSKMSGLITIDNYTDNQIKSLTGGIALQTECFLPPESVRSAKKSSKALAEFFWKIFKPTKFYPEDPEVLAKINASTKALYDEINLKKEGVATFPRTPKTFDNYIKMSLPFYLLVLLGKQRSRIAYFSHWQRCIVISNLYDKLNDTIQHFLLFLR